MCKNGQQCPVSEQRTSPGEICCLLRWDCFLWMKKAGMSTARWYILACQPLMFFKYFALQFQCTEPGSPNYSPRAKSRSRRRFIRPAKTFCHWWKNLLYLRKTCWFSEMHYIPKQSHCVRCPARELLCNSLCGPQIKKCGDPCTKQTTTRCLDLEDLEMELLEF